jgi:Flp pilus assembly protein TadD
VGRAAAAHADHAGALAAFEAATTLWPIGPDAHLELGRVLLSRGRTAAARDALRRATALAPGAADAHFWLGEAERKAGDPARAQVAYDLYLRLAPAGAHVEAARRGKRAAAMIQGASTPPPAQTIDAGAAPLGSTDADAGV